MHLSLVCAASGTHSPRHTAAATETAPPPTHTRPDSESGTRAEAHPTEGDTNQHGSAPLGRPPLPSPFLGPQPPRPHPSARLHVAGRAPSANRAPPPDKLPSASSPPSPLLRRRAGRRVVVVVVRVGPTPSDRAGLAEQEDDCLAAVLAGKVQSRLAVYRPRPHIGAPVEQQADDGHGALQAGAVQRRVAESHRRVHIGAPVEQEEDDGLVAP